MEIVHVVGMGLSREDLTQKHLDIIKKADLLVGGRRHLDDFPDHKGEKRAITKDIPGLIERIRHDMATRRIVVLASGDPLFYGIGSTLVKALGRERIIVHPNISTPAAAFAAIGEPWQEARLVSFHGRVPEDFHQMVQRENTLALLTDATHTPGWIAARLLERGMDDFMIHVFVCMGTDRQEIHAFESALQVKERSFAMPNMVILKRHRENRAATGGGNTGPAGMEPRPATAGLPVFPGMPREMFAHENGLITKSEVRSVVLSRLKLDADDYIFWDLGAGSGSVSIEVSRFLPRGRLFAVEKNSHRLPHIRANRSTFGVSNLTVVHGELPGAMAELPDPHRIFIGGGGRDIGSILRAAAERLRPGGILVVNTVLVQTMYLAVDTLKQMGWQTRFVQLQVSVSRPMPFGDRLEALNPVWIITGEKKQENKN